MKPGDPALSAVHVRLDNVGNGAAMPPLAKNVRRSGGGGIVAGLSREPDRRGVPNHPSPAARYVRLTALSEVNGNPWTAVGEFSVLDGNGSPIPISGQSIHRFRQPGTGGDEFSPVVRVIDGNPDTFWHTEWGAVESRHRRITSPSISARCVRSAASLHAPAGQRQRPDRELSGPLQQRRVRTGRR